MPGTLPFVHPRFPLNCSATMQQMPSSELLVRLEMGDNSWLADVKPYARLVPVSRFGHCNRSLHSGPVAYGCAFTIPQSLLQQYFLRLDRAEEVSKPAGTDPTSSGMFLPAFQDLATCNHDLLFGS